MTNNFKRSLGFIGIAIILLLAFFVWFKHKLDKVTTIPSIPGHIGLAEDEREVISFNEKTHRVIVMNSSGTIKMYARNPTVRVKKDGRILVDRHMFGFEARPLVGLGYSDTTRALLGFSPFYWGAFDASISAGITLDNKYVFVKPYVAGGYNCWGNMSVNAGVNPAGIKQLDVIIFMSLKI